MWMKVLLTAWMAWVLQAKERDGGKLTWAEVFRTQSQVPPPASSPAKGDDVKDFSDYDEAFFGNPDYVYVDTEDPKYRAPPVPEEDAPKTADRRTLDYLFHAFMDRAQTQNGRPVRGTSTTSRPTLIEAVFKTIDDHIVRDLQEWMAYSDQVEDAPEVSTAPIQSEGQLPTIQQAYPDNDELLLVTDEQGQQHVVTINDIVTSLGHLDEHTLTNLLLSPDQGVASERSTRWAIPPQPSPALEDPPDTAGVPITLGSRSNENEGVVQQHKDPAQATSDADTYLVRDEHGVVHVVTLQDIMTSLAQLDSNSVNDMLLAETDEDAPASIHARDPPAVTDNDSGWREHETDPFPVPIIDTDNHIVTHKGSVGVDRQETSRERATETQKIRGSVVHTDRNGNIHIIPNPRRPTQSTSPPRQSVENTKDLLQERDRGKHTSQRGQEILSFLTKTNLPTAVQPGGFSSLRQPQRVATQQQFRRNQVGEPIVRYIPSPSIVQPVEQITQPVPQTSNVGLGTTLSSMLSRLLGQGAPQQQRVAPTRKPELQEIRLLVKEQDRHTGNNLLGEVSIPLPRPIHYQPTPVSEPSIRKEPVQASSRVNSDPLPPFLHNLSPAVQAALRRQINNVPKFVPPGAQRRVLSTARMDVGPVEQVRVKKDALPNGAPTTVPKVPPAHLTTLTPIVLQKLRRQGERLRESPPSRSPTAVNHHKKPLDRSSYAVLPYDHHGNDYGHHGGYDHHGHDHEPDHPLLDIFLLADSTKVYKVGNTNLSVKAPKIGDSSQFVDTHSYHSHHHR